MKTLKVFPFLFASALFLCANFTFAQNQTKDELIDQINSLTMYYVDDNYGFNIVDSSGDVEYVMFDVDKDVVRYFNLKKDFNALDITYKESEDGYYIHFKPKNKIKMEVKGKTSNTNDSFKLLLKTNEVRGAFFHERILTLYKML